MQNIILDEILNQYKEFEQVVAIAIGGSSAAKTCDKISDIDIYVFVKTDIPLILREELVRRYSSKFEVGGEYFGSGDEFFVDKMGQQLDVMFWNIDWFCTTVENVWVKHFPSNGYTTAFLYTLNNFRIIYDKNGWLSDLQETIKCEYPKELQKNIIHRNIMLMKDKPFASYYEQIEKAIHRNDINSVNHRIAGFMASYFDIIFAINKLFHPGEKRLVKYAKEHCKILPTKFEENINKLFSVSGLEILNVLDDMIKNLKSIKIF
ncbi:DUF4037 domain-containing protein, partial [bacterium]|nr:DUF4037 domain-containing protein [bacterium]